MSHPYQHHFIVVEGLEGAGKTTAIDIIHQYLNAQSQTHLLVREPGGTRLGEALRTIIKEGAEDETINPISELLLMYAARAQLVKKTIEPALARGEWVVSDRFELSTYAYQGGGRNLDKAFIDVLSSYCVADCQPGLIFFMDILPEIGFERIKSRGKLDKMEQEPMLFFKKVYDNYHKMIREMPNVVRIDASLPLKDVEALVRHSLENYCNHDICL